MLTAVTVVLLGLVAVGSCDLSYGPCHDVNTVALNTEKWPGVYFVNVMTKNVGESCLWVNRTLSYADGNSANQAIENILISEDFRRIENGTYVQSLLNGTYVGEGHYQLTKEVASGDPIVFEVLWIHYDLPKLDCHFVCSDDERLKDGHGAVWCESASADALEKNACDIKRIMTENSLDVNDLMVVNNCDCPNMPFDYESSCEDVSIEEYFQGC